MPTKTAINNAAYNNASTSITPMLFHHIELGMTYDAVINIIGKSPLYCDSGKSHCNLENGSVDKECIFNEFIQPNQTWLCRWQGAHATSSQLTVWFVGNHVNEVIAHTDNGVIYRRDSANVIHLEKGI